MWKISSKVPEAGEGIGHVGSRNFTFLLLVVPLRAKKKKKKSFSGLGEFPLQQGNKSGSDSGEGLCVLRIISDSFLFLVIPFYLVILHAEICREGSTIRFPHRDLLFSPLFLFTACSGVC